jgi:hypothetical protein
MASRAPLPDSSASEPSGLKIRSRATKPRSSGFDRSSTPSEWTPICAEHKSAMRSGVSSKGSSASSTMM